jgi:hypothetical protein
VTIRRKSVARPLMPFSSLSCKITVVFIETLEFIVTIVAVVLLLLVLSENH